MSAPASPRAVSDPASPERARIASSQAARRTAAGAAGYDELVAELPGPATDAPAAALKRTTCGNISPTACPCTT